ncbi:heparan-alpha-glucosaminide N-acetyltransferase domain-containing protein [Sinomonas sp. G460-2]|uniref:heparan-alpha-glucosaminide N-acetyltransferase domain-containing protein n=1 Tax=Sinomonas sp. G460-2 TaxID=3393464 RepID=UPI0039EE9FD7
MAAQTTRPDSPSTAQRTPSRGRLTGIDMARGAALLTMMATHLLPVISPDAAGHPEPTWIGLVVSGRAAALFAVLAGVSLSLGRVPAAKNRLGLALRAAVIAAVGLSLGSLNVDISIILVDYGALFLCAIPVLKLGQRALGALAVSWILLAPLAAYGLRTVLRDGSRPLRLGHNPAWLDLMDPARFAADIGATGTYPVIVWFGYILAGLWIGRLPLRRLGVQIGLLAGGVAAAVLAKCAEWVLLGPLGGRDALLATPQARDGQLDALLRADLSDVDQTGSVWWLLTAAPHSGTALDLVHTCGTSAAVLAGFLLIARIRVIDRTRVLLPLAGAGGMTLTLYTAHVAEIAWSQKSGSEFDGAGLLAAHVLVALAAGLVFRLNGWRGPLERVTHAAYQLAAELRAPHA